MTEKGTGNAQPGACVDVLPRCRDFVALYVRMFVAGAHKVEGTMNWMIRNQ